VISFLTLILSLSIAGTMPDWSEGHPVPEDGNPNPYLLSQPEYDSAVIAGKIHAQIYPVTITGLLPPYRPLVNFVEGKTMNPIKALIQEFFKGFTGIESFNDVMAWVGVHPYPKESDTGVYSVPYPDGKRPDYFMGFTPMERNGAHGFTFSCAGCHSANLFGKTVLGMTNRFPRSNEAYVRVKQIVPYLNPTFFRIYNNATRAEEGLIREAVRNFKSVAVQKPLVLGLDTSLAQVSLSLARRNEDAVASKSREFEENPRPDYFDNHRADSKPAVWWNLKYKNRWLSDGSIKSGNPILTNFIWNEIGRGSDLQDLFNWMKDNEKTIKELTTAVFSSEPPRFTDFFSPEKIDIELAKQGEEIFNDRCARCHGHYEKAWSLPNSDQLSAVDKLKTTLVRYHQNTPVVDVGTDPWRYRGMKVLEKLNRLEISKNYGITVEAQTGYVPPPLVGIWSRWPYFHNNSVPSLCAVLTRHQDRPKSFYMGEANSTEKDFDSECNGYPVGQKTPKAWKKAGLLYNTATTGLSNSGHDEHIFLENGQEVLSAQQKKSLIQFLQTL
jgi:mono/diheme cytochrome c family protein